MSRHHLSKEEKNFLDELKLAQYIQSGSCGLKIAKIASGKGEMYFSLSNRISQWDTAAGYCIITEAGGKMTDMRGEALRYNTENICHLFGVLVTNGLLHADVVELYKIYQKYEEKKSIH